MLIRLNPADNVAIVTAPVRAGQELTIDGITLEAPKDLGLGHKIAFRTIPRGADVLKYAMPIGYAACDIAVGEHVHLHNISSRYTEIEDIEGTNA